MHPNTTKQLVSHCYPLPAPVKVVDDKLDFSPAGLGLRRRGASERRNPTKGRGCHTICVQVLFGLYISKFGSDAIGMVTKRWNVFYR